MSQPRLTNRRRERSWSAGVDPLARRSRPARRVATRADLGGYSQQVGAPSRLVELVPGVWLATSRQYATTTTVLLDGSGGAVVVDPAWDPDELAAIPADLAALGVRCVAGLATHEHYDHVLWHPGLGPGTAMG